MATPARWAFCWACVLVLAGAAPAHAAGALLYEVGTQDVGYASAGTALAPTAR